MAPTRRPPRLSAVRPVALLFAFSGITVPTNGVVSRLDVFNHVFVSTAVEEFKGNTEAFDEAINWHGQRLYSTGRAGAHVACAEYGEGLQTRAILEELLYPESVQAVSNHVEHGTCFIATVSPTQAASLSERQDSFGLTVFFPLPSIVKLGQGLLDHGSDTAQSEGSERLQTTFAKRMMLDNVHGLSVTLSPGTFFATDDASAADDFASDLRHSLMSESLDLCSRNFWSHPAMAESHGARSEASLRAREWTRAADVVQQLSSVQGLSPGDVCSWGSIKIHQADDDHLAVGGLSHLLPGGRGAGGKDGEESDELKMACFMGLVSFLTSMPEVLRISPLHGSKILNAVVASVIQAGTIDTTEKPLTAAGLDGTGEVIQIIDSGLDESSCFFADEDGEGVEHGYYYDEIGFTGDISSQNVVVWFTGGSFPSDLTRRKIVQYMRLVRPESATQLDSFTYDGAGPYPWYSASGFGVDYEGGHGTHTAGTAAGATLTTPATTDTCSGTDELGCVGGCLNQTYIRNSVDNLYTEFDTWCPQFECDGLGADFEYCLDEDIAETLTANGGVAQGAKLAVFDVSFDGDTIWGSLVGNGMWTATDGTGCLLHSNSWGGDSYCTVDAESISYDEYMHENPEHLLLFAAGNDGELKNDASRDGVCTINSPGIAKNVLTVGASSSGITRLTYTDENGDAYTGSAGSGDIDTIAVFSSYGFTSDYRIKPEVLAPGDQVLSASSDGTDAELSCKLLGNSGTSMATPAVAGAAAMIRQYFQDDTFYVADVNARGFCSTSTDTNSTNAFVCGTFSPYAATVKAMLVNSADLMGQSSEPTATRGFGRIYLEAGLVLDGAGDTALFVVDAADRSVAEYTIDEYFFTLNSDSGVEFRATLAWIDTPGSTVSSIQLIHDLDLTVVSPGGTEHRMWSTGADNRNVIERVIISAADVDADNDGEWSVAVSSASLTNTSQSYSLVVTGPISDGSGGERTRTYSAAARTITIHSVALCLSVTSTVAVLLFAGV